MKIALDLMGGDHAPEEIAAGAKLALADDPELELLIEKLNKLNEVKKVVRLN